jgi:uncharacterized membrane protein YsdA (DUF1294 family)
VKPSIRSKRLVPLLITLFALSAASAARASETRRIYNHRIHTVDRTGGSYGSIHAGRFGKHHGYSDAEFEWRHCGRDLYRNRHSESRLHGH